MDKRVLHLMRMWLECAVRRDRRPGPQTRTTVAKDSGRGIPQGSPHFTTAGQFVHAPVCVGMEAARPGAPPWQQDRHLRGRSRDPMPAGQGRRGPALLARDHRQAQADGERGEDADLFDSAEHFDFLGYTFGRLYSPRTGEERLGMRPSKKSIRRMVEKIHALTAASLTWQGTTELGAGGQVESRAARLGKLLSGRHGQRRVPRARSLHRPRGCVGGYAQAQGSALQGRELSTLAPVRALRARTPDRARGCGLAE